MAVPTMPSLRLESLKCEETMAGEVVYRMGGQFWPTRCQARLTGDLLLIQRSGKQEAAVTLHGASVELRPHSTVCIEVPGSPLLALRLRNDQEAEQWWHALQEAANRAKGFKELMNASLPMLSPRSEAEWTEAESLMERMRSELAEKETLTQDTEAMRKVAEEGKSSAERQVELLTKQLEQSLTELEEAKSSLEERSKEIDELTERVAGLQEELDASLSKLAAANAELAATKEAKQNSEVAAESKLADADRELALAKEKQQRLEQTVEKGDALAAELRRQLEQENAKAEQVKAAKEVVDARLLEGAEALASVEQKLIAERSKRDHLEVLVAKLEAQLEAAGQQAQMASEGKLSDLTRRHGASEQRLVAAERCRVAAEERSRAAEERLAEAEEQLERKTKEVFAARRELELAKSGKASGAMLRELEELRKQKTQMEQMEERLRGLDAAAKSFVTMEQQRDAALARAKELEVALAAVGTAVAVQEVDPAPEAEPVEDAAEVAEAPVTSPEEVNAAPAEPASGEDAVQEEVAAETPEAAAAEDAAEVAEAPVTSPEDTPKTVNAAPAEPASGEDAVQEPRSDEIFEWNMLDEEETTVTAVKASDELLDTKLQAKVVEARIDYEQASTAEGTPQGTMEVEELPCGKVLTLETFNVLEA